MSNPPLQELCFSACVSMTLEPRICTVVGGDCVHRPLRAGMPANSLLCTCTISLCPAWSDFCGYANPDL